mgnify:FL=1
MWAADVLISVLAWVESPLVLPSIGEVASAGWGSGCVIGWPCWLGSKAWTLSEMSDDSMNGLAALAQILLKFGWRVVLPDHSAPP